MGQLPEKFEQALSAGKLILPGEKVFIGCSGGPDSVALFHLLRLLSPEKWKLRLGLLHLNHGMRGKEAARDLRFVERLGRKYGVPVITGRARVYPYARKNRLSPEEAARELRYRFLVSTAKKRRAGKLALAHTLDDQAETILMRMIQGTGSRGLLGIREKVIREKVAFVRPLLGFRKRELLDFLEASGFDYRIDRTNETADFLRNRLRKDLLPRLARGYNPRIAEALARIPVILQEETAALDQSAGDFFRSKVKARKGRARVSRKDFEALPAALQFRVLNAMLGCVDSRSGIHYDNWMKLRTELARKRFRYSLKKDVEIFLSPSEISVYKRRKGNKVI